MHIIIGSVCPENQKVTVVPEIEIVIEVVIEVVAAVEIIAV